MSKLLFYCTKNKWRLFFDKVKQIFSLGKIKSNNDLNGKIVAECDYEVVIEDTSYNCIDFRLSSRLDGISKLDESCLTSQQLFDYVKGRNFFYAIHIKNLHIFDKPKKLSDYYNYYTAYSILKAPQNMMYATSDFEDYMGIDLPKDKYILISIQPQHLCKILNGEKTVEVRRVVLKEMLK